MQVDKKNSAMQTNDLVVSERKVIGERLTEFRKKKKMTQEELAAELGVTKSSINKMEKGVWISLEMLIRLSVILEFKVTLLDT